MAQLPTYNVSFGGYILDKDRDKLPEYSGVYMIYRCVYNEVTKKGSLIELFYIGKATNIQQEICYHKRRSEFLAHAKQGEQICYAYASVNRVQYDVVENGLIFMQKPSLNNNLVDSYNHHDAEFHFSGRCGLLKNTNYQIVNQKVIPL